MARSSNKESQVLPDIHAMRGDVQRVQESLLKSTELASQTTIERLKQEGVDREARHVREMEQQKEIGSVKMEISGVAGALKELAVVVKGISADMTAQNTELKQLAVLSQSVNTLMTSHAESKENQSWLKKYVMGILLTMGFTLILGIIGAVYGVKLPSEPADAAIIHHHKEVMEDEAEPNTK